MTTRSDAVIALMLLVVTSTAAIAHYNISSFKIGGGGGTSAVGSLTLAGAIGQPDASSTPMTGGGFTLVGGFWPAAGGGACTLPGDMNLDGAVDGEDVQRFVNCLLTAAGSNCGCADFNGGGLSPTDVPPFVTVLLGP